METITFIPARDAGTVGMGAHWVRKGRMPTIVTTLNALMEMDHVIRVNDDGTVSDDVSGAWAPELVVYVGADGQEDAGADTDLIETAKRSGWEIQSGWSGQNSGRYGGPNMHRSEFVGGDLAEHVLSTPGLWVVTYPSVIAGHCAGGDDTCDDCTGLEDRGSDYWLIMRRDAV